MRNRVLFFLLIGIFSPHIICGQILGNPLTSVGYINICDDNDQPIDFMPFSELPFSTDIEFGPDGELYVMTFLPVDSLTPNGDTIIFSAGFMVAEYDFRSEKFRDTIYKDYTIENPGYSSLGFSRVGYLMVNKTNEVLELEINSGVITNSFRVNEMAFGPQDIMTLGDTIFAAGFSRDDNQGVFLYNNDRNPNNIGFYEIPRFTLPGIGVTWKEDCSERLLVVGAIDTLTQEPTRNRIDLLTTDGRERTEICSYLINPPSANYFYGIASYDSYVNVCELRLDLDADNSSSRFGPHFWQDPNCTASYPVADEDVDLRSLVGSLDSVTVKLRSSGSQPGIDRLVAPATGGVQVRRYGDTLLHIIATDQTTDADFLSYLPTITLQVDPERVIIGERIIETYAYAGGLQSDQARTFIQVNPNASSYAGQNAEVIACADGTINLLAALGPDVTSGGDWRPIDFPNNTWSGGTHPYGIYRYIVQANDCPADTAVIAVVPPTSVTPLLPLVNASVDLCRGKILQWSVDIPEVRSVRWDDGSTDRIRTIIENGVYFGTITEAGGCLEEEIFLKVSEAPPGPRPSTSIVRNCIGDTVLLATGFFLTQDSIVETIFDRGLLCDSVHLTLYRFAGPVAIERFDTICLGDTLTVGNTSLTQIGNYDFTLLGGSCDSVLTVRLSHYLPDTAYLDSTLLVGQEFMIGDTSFSTSGTYEVFSPGTGMCGELLILTLDFITSSSDLAATSSFWHPTLLRRGRDVFRFHPSGNTVDLKLKELAVFDAGGRIVRRKAGEQIQWRPAAHLSVGIYFYRARLIIDGEQQFVTGRMVVTD
jgi:hypothetical protein